MATFIFSFLAACIAALITWIVCRTSSAKSMATQATLNEQVKGLQSALDTCRQEGKALQGMLDDARHTVMGNEKSMATLEAEVKAKEELIKQQKEFVATVREDMEREFRLIAATTLDHNAQKFGEQQGSRLNDLLKPFSEQIDAFRKQVDERFTTEVADRNTLKGEITKMMELNQAISKEAHNLTTALTKQTKQQGTFGETILETLLSNAGMVEGEHFYRQHSTSNVDGQRIQPDIVINCPGGYCIVVDSKVSLTHYVRYCDGNLSPEDEKMLRKEIWQSFRNHIDGLSVKKYESIPNAADFVLMFTPVEAAFTVASAHDPELRHYAFRKKIFFVTPSNLLLVIKMIADLWQKDRVNKQAEEMANRAKALYEKACGFLDSFVGVGKSLDNAKDEWEKARIRLSGNGGIVRQGEMLQKLLDKKSVRPLPKIEEEATIS